MPQPPSPQYGYPAPHERPRASVPDGLPAFYPEDPATAAQYALSNPYAAPGHLGTPPEPPAPPEAAQGDLPTSPPPVPVTNKVALLVVLVTLATLSLYGLSAWVFEKVAATALEQTPYPSIAPTHPSSQPSGTAPIAPSPTPTDEAAERASIDAALTYAHLAGNRQYVEACGFVLDPSTDNPAQDGSLFMDRCVSAHVDALQETPEAAQVLSSLTPDDIEAHGMPDGSVRVTLLGHADLALVLSQARDGSGWYVELGGF